jgi:hypothetical protein
MSVQLFMAVAAFSALGSGVLVYFIMQSRMEVLLSKQREDLAAARATLAAQQASMEDSVRNAGNTAREAAMDDFLADIRIEERHYTREHKMLFLTKKMLVRQERIFFRNIPLTNWIENEMQIEEGVDADKLAKTMSIFGDFPLNAALGPAPGAGTRRRLTQ